MSASGIVWPSGPYRLPGHRAATVIAGLACAALILISAGTLVALTLTREARRDLADAAATLGFGRTVPGARVSAVACSRFQRKADVYYYCDVTVAGSPAARTYEIVIDHPPEPQDATRVARVGSRVAVGWRLPVMLDRLSGYLVVAAICLALIGAAAWLLWIGRRKRFRLDRTARIADVDLLWRTWAKDGALWDFAYDHRGERRYRQGFVTSDPVIVDGVVTRGAALISGAGEALLLTVAMTPCEASAWAATREAIARRFARERPPLEPGFADLATTAAAGAERDFVAAFGRAWAGSTVAEVNAAIEDRHRAAAALPPTRVAALLREARRFAPGS